MTKQEFIEAADLNCEEGTCNRCDELRKELDSIIQQAIAEEKEKVCEWVLTEMLDDVYEGDTWKPGCKEGDGWEYPQGEAFTDEIVGYTYCPFCSKKIKRI